MSAAQVLKELDILEACQITFAIIATMAFLARVYVRTRMIRRFSVDDWFMGGAVVGIARPR